MGLIWRPGNLQITPEAAAGRCGKNRVPNFVAVRFGLQQSSGYNIAAGVEGVAKMASVSDWKVPSSAQPKPEDYPLRSRSGAGLYGGVARDRAVGCVHGGDARHRARRQRRLHPRQRARPDHRLSDHRGGHDLADVERWPLGARPCARLRPGNRFRPGAGAGQARHAGARISANRRRLRSASASSSPAPAGGSIRSPRASSPSRNSPAIGNMCSTKRSSPRRRIRTGAAPP